jgi:hypothetical protein
LGKQPAAEAARRSRIHETNCSAYHSLEISNAFLHVQPNCQRTMYCLENSTLKHLPSYDDKPLLSRDSRPFFKSGLLIRCRCSPKDAALRAILKKIFSRSRGPLPSFPTNSLPGHSLIGGSCSGCRRRSLCG